MSTYSKKEIGDFGEKECARYLKKLKYKILDKNARFHHLEADIIATNKTHVVFVEVKTRSLESAEFIRPSSAVDKKKQSNLRSFAYAYIKSLPKKHNQKQFRMDVCEIVVSSKEGSLEVSDFNYIENAF
jgi:putative endonuclease